MVFNAFKYVEVLKDAGVPDKQAQAQVRILNEVLESNLATKQDVEIIKGDIEGVKQATKRDIAEVKRDIEELKLATKRDIAEIKRDIEELKLATKRDIAEIKRDIESLRQDTKRDLKELEQRMIIKLGALLTIAVTAIAIFLK